MATKEKSSKGIAGDGFPAGRGEEGDRTGDLFSQAERADLGIKERKAGTEWGHTGQVR